MAGRFCIDHVVIKVDDLEAAGEDYTGLGFSVAQGGAHERWGSRNALVPFDDGSYLELIALGAGRGGGPGSEHSRMERRLLAREGVLEGLVDYALLPGDMGEELARVRACGLDFAGPLPGGRVRPDGQAVSWEMGLPDRPDLPFLCGDVTPRGLRVPEGEARAHPNGAMGISEVAVAVEDLEASADRYEALLGVGPEQEAGVEGVRYACGGARIVLAEPAGQEGPVRAHLEARGEGPFRVVLSTRFEDRAGPVDSGRTCGVQMAFAYEGSGGRDGD